jgi:NAD(P)-dependent dehydrogenase (short-subunit alcohol dehydrogenase family)
VLGYSFIEFVGDNLMNQKIAVVTGANRGIGFEVCCQLAQKGIHVILTSRDENKGHDARARLTAEGLEVTCHPLEVTDPESIRDLESLIQKDYGRLDILVNNAGVYLEGRVSLLNVEIDTLRFTMETNFYGPLFLSRAFIPLMKKKKYGRVVNVSSGGGQMANMGRGYPAYKLSKVALNAMTRILADELRGTNILVNTMCPGWVRTDMGGRAAPSSVEEGADTIIWLATLPDGGPQGGFFRDRKPIPW